MSVWFKCLVSVYCFQYSVRLLRLRAYSSSWVLCIKKSNISRTIQIAGVASLVNRIMNVVNMVNNSLNTHVSMR